jgi:hypothetical protein
MGLMVQGAYTGTLVNEAGVVLLDDAGAAVPQGW